MNFPDPLIIPPNLFPPQYRWTIYIYVFPSILVFGVIALIIFWKLVVPQPAKEIFWNRMSKLDYFQIFTTSGHTVLKRGKVYAEGIAETKEKNNQIYLLPRPISTALKDDAEKGETERKALKPYLFRGAGGMMWLGYEAKAVVTNILTLLGLQKEETGQITVTKEMLKKLGKLKGAMKDEAIKKLIELGKYIGDEIELKVFLPVDGSVIKKHFTPMYNQSQIKAYGNRREAIGERKRAGDMWKIMLPALILVGFGIFAMLLIKLA